MFQSSVRSSLVVLAVLVGAPVLAAGAEPIRTLPAELADWPAGPVRWLLLPDELRVFRALETREAAMAKMFATETAHRVVDEAVQLCGGLGVTRGHPVERLYREVRALRIYEGATEVQKLIIARELLR